VYEDVTKKTELCFETGDSKRCLVELDLLFVEGVRSVIAAQNIESSVRQSLEQRLDVPFGSQGGFIL
jgi:hypothetical protein